MTERTCYKCHQPGGKGPRELRPYGPKGSDVCAECVFGKKGDKPNPKMVEEALRQLGQRFLEPGPHILDTTEQVGPRPLKPKSRKN